MRHEWWSCFWKSVNAFGRSGAELEHDPDAVRHRSTYLLLQ
ncbi:hypothetical protein NY08_4384 [Rhodococcus sp. B7740]|nr:hypothetical protein NY08_4384 [Rhodococcus sp. B7740]